MCSIFKISRNLNGSDKRGAGGQKLMVGIIISKNIENYGRTLRFCYSSVACLDKRLASFLTTVRSLTTPLQFVQYFCGMVFGKYLHNEMS